MVDVDSQTAEKNDRNWSMLRLAGAKPPAGVGWRYLCGREGVVPNDYVWGHRVRSDEDPSSTARLIRQRVLLQPAIERGFSGVESGRYMTPFERHRVEVRQLLLVGGFYEDAGP